MPHVAEREKLQLKFEEKLKIFIPNAFAATLVNMVVPTWKSSYKRFKNIAANHRGTLRVAQAFSTVDGKLFERTQLLENTVLELDDELA